MAQRKVENLEAIITIDTPYTNFGKKVAVSSDAITIGQFAKLLRNNDIVIGRNRLFTLLRDRGYLIKKGKDKNMPKQTYLEQGLFKIAENVVKTVEGEILSTTTLVTGKGQMYFLDLLSNQIIKNYKFNIKGDKIMEFLNKNNSKKESMTNKEFVEAVKYILNHELLSLNDKNKIH